MRERASRRYDTTSCLANTSTSSSRVDSLPGMSDRTHARVVDPHRGELEVERAVVVQDEEEVLAADDGVLEGVLDAVTTGEHDAELALGIVGLEDSHLAGDLGARVR